MTWLRGTFTIIRKELAAYFNSPIAYIFLFVFVALVGFLFMSQFFLVSRADMRVLFDLLPLILCVFLPAVTMRLWAEEKQSGTYELLLTFPMPPHALVLGKFIASLIFYLAALAATFTIPVMLMAIGRPDVGPIIGGYLGAACLGAFFLAVGLFVSGLCRDQIIAFIVAMLSCFAFFLLGTEFIASTIDGWLPGLGGLLMNAVGVSRHVAGLHKGVVDLRDLLYFALGTSLALILNGFWIEGRMRPKQRRIFAIASAAAAAIFVLGNWLASELPLGRLDLTEGRLYTVSPVSRKILGGLKAPVTVKYYVSPADKMPTGFKTLERDVLDKLDEFRLASGGKFRYKVFHMEAANVAQAGDEGEEKESLEASLQRKGVQPFQVQSIEADELGLRLVYSSIAIAYKEKPEEILPRIIPSNLSELEYLVLSTIYRMTLTKQPRVALMAPFEEKPIDPALRSLMEQLGRTAPERDVDDPYRLIPPLLEYEGYRVTRTNLTEDEPIPADTKTLVVLEPRDLTEPQQQAISRFLVKGGSVLLAAQHYQFDYTTSYGEMTVLARPQSPNVSTLLGAWGLSLDERVLLDASQDAISVGGGMRLGPFAVNLPLKLPIHIRVNPDSMNQELSITSRLSPMLYLWGSALTLDERAIESRKLTAQVLMRSSEDSWLIPPSQMGTISPTSHPRRGDPLGPFPLAVLLEGEFPDPFAGARAETLRRAPGKLLVIGAVTPFQEQLIETGGHLHFLLNAVDTLSLGEDLIQIRAKQPVDRTIGHISSGAKASWRFFVSLLVPLVIAGVGWARMLLRRRVKHQYLQLVKASA